METTPEVLRYAAFSTTPNGGNLQAWCWMRSG